MKMIKVKNSGVIKLGKPDAKRGGLAVAEANKHIPFEIQRVYFIHDLRPRSAPRGGHAHKTHQQAIFCLRGSFELHLDDGQANQVIVLNTPSEGILLGPKLWHTMDNFSDSCVIAVFASHHYDENDYIRNYSEFLTLI